VANGLTVFVGSRVLDRGAAAAKEIGAGAIAVQLDVTDSASIEAAATHIRQEFGRLDLLINNAGISNTSKGTLSLEEYAKVTRASTASLDEVRAVGRRTCSARLPCIRRCCPSCVNRRTLASSTCPAALAR